MSLIVAVNFPDRLVLLEDGRELPISRFLTRDGEELEDHHDAFKFQVDIPHSGTPPTFLEVDTHAMHQAKPTDVN